MMQEMMLPSAPYHSKPRENFRSKKFELSDRKLTPSRNHNTTCYSQETPPMKPRRIQRTFLTEQRDTMQQEITPLKSIDLPPKNGSLQSFEKILSHIDFTSGSKISSHEMPHIPKSTPSFIRRSVKKNSGIKSEEKTIGLSSTIDTSREDLKPSCKLHFSNCKEPKVSEPRREVSSFGFDGMDVPFRRRRFASVDLVLKKRKLSRSRRENDKTSKNLQIWSLNRIIQEDSDEASTQRGRDRDADDIVNDNDDTEKEWRFVLSGSDREAKIREEYEKELQNIDDEIVEFIRMGIARKGLLMNKMKSQHGQGTASEKALSEELARMKDFIENAVVSYYQAKGSNITNTP